MRGIAELSTLASILPALWSFAVPIAASIPLGLLMARVLDVSEGRCGRGLDALPMCFLRVIGRRVPARMDWRRYSVAMLTFNAALFAISFGLLYVQHRIPPNPDGKESLGHLGFKDSSGVDHPGADSGVAFNTACSFVTNCSLQHYAGEQNLDAFGQIGIIAFLGFVSAATGMACLVAVVRGLRGDEHLGDFYLDLVRSLLFVLIPLATILALSLVASGVPMTVLGSAQAATLDGSASQSIARGPVAALVAIKQLGTIGGGFFGPNSAHPLENPDPSSNMLEMIAIILLPMASIVLLGRMLRDARHAVVVFVAMLVPTLAGAGLSIREEMRPNSSTTDLPVAVGPNFEGKEARFGAPTTATWAAITTATSNGSVDGMLDSFRPLGGLAAFSLLLINSAFSGVGSGFLHMLVFIIVAVFLGSLMVGRTPEYLGRKVEAREVKLAMIALLLHPLVVCVGTAAFAATNWGKTTTSNPGAHGFSEIFYEFASSAATNGSGFEGLSDDNPPWNIATGIVMMLGRYPGLIAPLAIAGSLSTKPRLARTSGTLRTDDATFGGLLLGILLLVGALSFLPALVLGPVADALAPDVPQGAGP